MNWWIWIIAGAVLLGVEVLTPGGFYVFFFGIGAILIGILLVLGLPLNTTLQLLMFLSLSVVLLLVFRRRLLPLFETKKSNEAIEHIISETAFAKSELPPNGYGQVEFRGTSWNAKNIGAIAINTNNRCIIRKVAGLMLEVELESNSTGKE
ncbi:MAG: NfeD family protein [bacterium]|nr:NfeD family protein [bacterium]